MSLDRPLFLKVILSFLPRFFGLVFREYYNIPPQEAKYIAQLSEQFKQYYEEFNNTEDIQLDVDKQFFESVKSLLNTALLGHLGLELAEKISLTQNKKGQPFYLNVKPENIEIIDRFKN